MDSQLFYILNFIFGGIFLIWFLFGRKPSSKPTPLNLTAGSQKSKSSTVPQAQRHNSDVSNIKESSIVPQREYPVKYTPRERDVTASKSIAEQNLKNSRKKRSDGCLFIYNGHDWDAYEVLGVTSETSLHQVTEKYQMMIKNSDQGRLEFLESAFNAIVRKY